MNIPAVIGIGEDLKKEYDGKEAIVDGMEGVIYIDPDKETFTRMREKQKHCWSSLRVKKILRKAVRK